MAMLIGHKFARLNRKPYKMCYIGCFIMKTIKKTNEILAYLVC